MREIFANASSFIKKPTTLSTLVTEIDKLDWYNARQEGLGDLYEGLLEKNANEKKSGAGQYFTPRPLIDSMVAVMKPTLEDIIQDPAAGTGGFLIAANHYIREHRRSRCLDGSQQEISAQHLLRHGTRAGHAPPRADESDASRHRVRPRAAASVMATRSRLRAKPCQKPTDPDQPAVRHQEGRRAAHARRLHLPTSNKQFAFLQHIYRGLQPGGRAAVVLPDNVLFESNTGQRIRRDLMDKCNLHTILRLPTGIFYAQGVKTNVLFFTRGETDKGNTKEVWVYDLRANMPSFGKRTEFTREHFAEFEAAFGDDPLGKPKSLAKRKDTGENGRFRRFTREWIAERGDSLDIAWLRDESETAAEDLPEPEALAQEAMGELEAAMAELHSIMQELGIEVGE